MMPSRKRATIEIVCVVVGLTAIIVTILKIHPAAG